MQAAQIQIPQEVWDNIPTENREMLDMFLYALNKSRVKKLDDFIQERVPFLKLIPDKYLKKVMGKTIKIEVKQSSFGEIHTLYAFGKRKGVLRMKNINIEVYYNNDKGELHFITK